MKKILFSLLASVVMISMFVSSASAWNYGLTAASECQPDGSRVITWTIDNTEEKEALSVTASNRAIVPVGSSVSAQDTFDFSEKVPGTAHTTTLTVKGNFPSDKQERERTFTVKDDKDCIQLEKPTQPVVKPVPPVTPQPEMTPVTEEAETAPIQGK